MSRLKTGTSTALLAASLVEALGSGRLSIVAGTGEKGYSPDGTTAMEARLNNPYGLSRGPSGALYFCDVENHVVRKITSSGSVVTVAGSGVRGYSGDGGPATSATLNEPYEVRFDRAGNMFFVERLNHVIRKVDAKTGMIETVAGDGSPGFAGDGGAAVGANFKQPHSLQFDTMGDLYICDIGNHRVRKIETRTKKISTFGGDGRNAAPFDGGGISTNSLAGPRALDFDRTGQMWIALREGNAIYRVDMKTGLIRRAAGNGKSGFTGNGGPALAATLSGPKGIAVGPDQNVYFADTESHTIRMIDVRRNSIELVAGTGERGRGLETDPLRCRLNRPHGVFVDADGSILIGDSESHLVRRVEK